MSRLCRSSLSNVAVTLAMFCLVRNASAAEEPHACRPPLETWDEVDFYFGLQIRGGGTVTEKMFNNFLEEIVTPRFPDGFSVLDVAGQYRDSEMNIIREPSKLLIILVPNATLTMEKTEEIIERYKELFLQESVLYEEHKACISFKR